MTEREKRLLHYALLMLKWNFDSDVEDDLGVNEEEMNVEIDALIKKWDIGVVSKDAMNIGEEGSHFTDDERHLEYVKMKTFVIKRKHCRHGLCSSSWRMGVCECDCEMCNNAMSANEFLRANAARGWENKLLRAEWNTRDLAQKQLEQEHLQDEAEVVEVKNEK